MDRQFKYLLIGISSFLLMLASCQESGSTDSVFTVTENGSGEITTVDYEPTDNSVLEYTHNLGSVPQDVYFIFTNTNSSNVTTATSVSSQYIVSEPLSAADSLKSTGGDPVDLTTWARENGVGLRGKPVISAFNAMSVSQSPVSASGMLKKIVAEEPSFVTVGNIHTFMNASTTDTIDATARAVVTDGTVTLNIWVEDDSWGTGCSKHHCITSAMVTAFADKFLQSGSPNDIYDWDSSIFGAPWGTHSYSNLIPASAASEIDILFFDIDDDGNSATDDDPDGGVLGFFWSKDNFLTSSYDYSNERLLFYMDSVLTAKKEDATWEITDEWPSEMVSTLAHEFQHMIHFYQKNVRYNASPETWINEMSSMIAEDLVADKVGVNGPRGVRYNTYTAGDSGNTAGRLPMFNNYNYYGVTSWFYGSMSLINYALNYSFGAYLARNYGGAELFRKIVQSQYEDEQAITEAVTAMGYSGETFTTLLQKWGVAVLLSDLTTAESGYQYNTGSSFSVDLDSITYNLGSINLYNYDYDSQSGPKLYTPSTLSDLGGHYGSSNTYVLVGEGETGTFSATIDMEPGMQLTVVTKDSD